MSELSVARNTTGRPEDGTGMPFARWELLPDNEYETTNSNVSSTDLDFITRYALWREAAGGGADDQQSPGVFAYYNDPVMAHLHAVLHPRMELVTGLRLHPTYCYFRVYRPGAILEKHKDRPACEVSASMLVGANYDPIWPLYLSLTRCGHANIKQKPGDLLLYRGCDVLHWREASDFSKDNFSDDSYHVQLFLHYVDMDGPYWMCARDDDDPRAWTRDTPPEGGEPWAWTKEMIE